jgi:hypothetical protein
MEDVWSGCKSQKKFPERVGEVEKPKRIKIIMRNSLRFEVIDTSLLVEIPERGVFFVCEKVK